MKTTVNAIEMVKAAGVTAVGEIRLFLMETRAITIDVMKAALVENGYGVPTGRPKKIEVADLLARAVVDMAMDEEIAEELMAEEIETTIPSAAGETPVAEENNNKEESAMTVKKTLQEITNEKNMKALENSPMLRKLGTSMMDVKGHAAYENPAIGEMLAKVHAAKDRYLENIGELAVTIEDIEFYPTEQELVEEGFTRHQIRKMIKDRKVVRELPKPLASGSIMRFIGEVTVRMPEGYAQIKKWNPNKPNSKGKLGAPEWIDFVGYDLNLVKRPFNMRRPLAEGTGLVVLSIFEFEDVDGVVSLPQVSLPTEKGSDGTRYPIFQTADVRYAKSKDAEEADMPLYLQDNNESFNAQVTAFLQMFTNEFMQADPKNHHGFKKTSCVNMVRFQTRDGVMDDEHMASKKSRVILEQPDVMQLAQVGSEQPNTYCTVLDKFLDLEAVEILNEAEKMERAGAEGRDEDGEVRFQRHDEIMVAGKLMKRNTVRESIIEKNCAACPFYCGNSPKAESQVSKEKAENKEKGGNGFVSAFYRERPKAKAQAVQTLVKENGKSKWVTKFPYELLGKVEDIMAIRVKGAGMTVYGSDAVMELIDPEYVVPVEEFDARHATVMKQINQIFYAAFNLDKLSESQAELVFELADNKPEGLTDNESERWDNAVHWLTQSLGWAQEREAAKNIAPFTTKFFAGVREGAVELHIEDIMGDTLYRAETNQLGWGLGYDDLFAAEFVRYLDEVAIDYVYEVIMNGTEYAVVGGTDKDKELASGALQEMLQRELNWTWVRGVRRDADQAAALAELKVSDEVKGYIAQVIGLNK
jgi:hypothetical protein